MNACEPAKTTIQLYMSTLNSSRRCAVSFSVAPRSAACGSRCMATVPSEVATEAVGQSVSMASVGGAASPSAESASGSGAVVLELLSADEELQREWEVFGRPELYEAPAVQELRDLASSRHRSRGERERRKRLKRNRQLLERMKKAEPAVPPYLLDRDDESGGAASEPLPQAMSTDSADSDGGGNHPAQGSTRIHVGGSLPTLPWAELQRRVADGMRAQPGEDQAQYDARVRADRLARGAALGDYFDGQPAADDDAMPPLTWHGCRRCGQHECSSCGNDNPLARTEGGSADMYYVGPDDHERMERREREARARPVQRKPPPMRGDYDALDGAQAFDEDWRQWYERETGESLDGGELSQHKQCGLEARLASADPPDDHELEFDRALDEAGRSSLFYGQPLGDMPEGAAPPLGWHPPNFVALQVAAREAERQRMARAVHAGVPPPQRTEYAAGEEGRESFRADRRAWYERVTGDLLEGVSIAEQHRLCHDFARRYRTYTDGRSDRTAKPPPPTTPAAPLPPAPLQPPPSAASSTVTEPLRPPPLYEPLFQMPSDSPQWKLKSNAELHAMSVAELQTWRQKRLREVERARVRVQEIRLPAALDMQEAIGELNQTKQLIQRIEMDIYYTEKELRSRSPAAEPAAEESSDDDIVIDDAPPDVDDWR